MALLLATSSPFLHDFALQARPAMHNGARLDRTGGIHKNPNGKQRAKPLAKPGEVRRRAPSSLACPTALQRPLLSGEVVAFVPLQISPERAKDEDFDKKGHLKDKIKLHLSNLTKEDLTKRGGVRHDQDCAQFVPREIVPIYTFRGSIPDDMPYAKGYPHQDKETYGGFKGIIKFVFDDYTWWDDFAFLMYQCDSDSSCPSALSWLHQLDFPNARVLCG